jgi:hypothetical protein
MDGMWKSGTLADTLAATYGPVTDAVTGLSDADLRASDALPRLVGR